MGRPVALERYSETISRFRVEPGWTRDSMRGLTRLVQFFDLHFFCFETKSKLNVGSEQPWWIGDRNIGAQFKPVKEIALRLYSSEGF